MDILSIIVRLVVAVVLSGIIGFEREQRHKPAGMRTNMLVGLGTAAMAIASVEMSYWTYASGFTVDPSRVASTILTGIGFIGAGTIIHARGRVEGLTTAASIWVVAAIGLASGLGMLTLALALTVIAAIILIVLPKNIDVAGNEKEET